MNYFQTGKQVIRKLVEQGYEAYFVGGFVRDYLLGNKSDDIDITTNATPEQVKVVFKKVKYTGKKYGTVTVFLDSHKYEVTTYRKDGTYNDNRRPEEVTFSTSLEDDLERRDFTINALVMNHKEEIFDFHNGQIDLKNKLIRTIGNPRKRFNEDALRMLRAFRFVSKLGFDIDTEIIESVNELKHLTKKISIERIMVELEKTFNGEYANKAIRYLVKSQLHKELFGLEKGLNFLQTKEVQLNAIETFTLCFILDDFNDVWRFSNKQRRLIETVMHLHETTKDGMYNKFIVFSYGLDVCLMTNKISSILGYEDQEERIYELDKELVVKDVCDLAFKGQDILELTNLKKRSVIALVIDDLLYNVIMGIMNNEYEELKEFALQRVEELQNEMERKQ